MLVLVPDFSQYAEISTTQPNHIAIIGNLLRQQQNPYILANGYQVPDLRTQLHRLGLYEQQRWDVYDDIQGITQQEGISYLIPDLHFPAHVLPVFSENKVYLDHGQSRVMEVELHPLGFVWKVLYFAEDGGMQCDQYDDRGFVRWRKYYNPQQQLIKQEWLNQNGAVVLVAKDHRIFVAPAEQARFNQSVYLNFNQLIREFIVRRVATLSEPFEIITSLRSHYLSIHQILPDQKETFFIVTQVPNELDTLKKNLNAQDCLIFDSQTTQHKFEQAWMQQTTASQPLPAKQQVIPLFPSRLALGNSNEQAEMIINWAVGDWPESAIEEFLTNLFIELKQHLDWRLVVDSSNRDLTNLQAKIETKLYTYFQCDPQAEAYQLISTYLAQNDEIDYKLRNQPELKQYSDWEQIVACWRCMHHIEWVRQQSWPELSERMEHARIFCDTSSLGQQRLQTEAVSRGIPIIGRVATEFLISGENGTIIQSPADFQTSLKYYLEQLHTWNATLISNIRLIEHYSDTHLVTKWEELVYGGKTMSRDS